MQRTIKHIPFNKPRTSTPSEVLYLEYWQEYAEKKTYVDSIGCERTNFDFIFSGNPQINKQRAASIAASFVVYMGCNCGKSFTHRAEDFYRKLDGLLSREDAYVSIWALENKRQNHINGGMIPMELMVGRKFYNTKANMGRGAWETRGLNKMTPEDIEIINIMVAWWSSDDAKKLREDCEPLARKKTEEILNGLYAHNF